MDIYQKIGLICFLSVPHRVRDTFLKSELAHPIVHIRVRAC